MLEGRELFALEVFVVQILLVAGVEESNTWELSVCMERYRWPGYGEQRAGLRASHGTLIACHLLYLGC